MNNRITPYEAGWLSMLVERGIATQAEAEAAFRRVCDEAVKELERRAKEKRRRRKRRKDQ